MLLIYEPEDSPRREFIFKPGELLSFDSEAIEEVGGATWGDYGDFVERLDDGNMKARRALLWIFLRRDNPDLQFSDLVVKVKELRVDFDTEQIADLRGVINDETADAGRREDARQLLARFGHPEESEEVGKDEPDATAIDSP